MMDRQAILNTAYLGLAGQGFRVSLDDGEGCAYRGIDGLKCAIGHCIPDDRYSPDLEGNRAYARRIVRALWFAPDDLSIQDKSFLDGLQHAHDEANDQNPMRGRLEAFAKDYGLTIPDLPQKEEAE